MAARSALVDTVRAWTPTDRTPYPGGTRLDLPRNAYPRGHDICHRPVLTSATWRAAMARGLGISMPGSHGGSSVAAALRWVAWAAPMAETCVAPRHRELAEPDLVEADRRAAEASGDAGFVRLAAAAAVGLNALLPLVELGRATIFQDLYGDALVSLLATAGLLPLHLRHVLYALRGERPPAAGWTLAALAIIDIGAAMIVGAGWIMNLASLAVSVLLVVRGRWAGLLVVAVVLAAGPLAGTGQYQYSSVGAPGLYLIFSVAWRSVTLFVLVWLVSTARQLESTRRELRDRAVVRERLRLQAELRGAIGGALE